MKNGFEWLWAAYGKLMRIAALVKSQKADFEIISEIKAILNEAEAVE